MSRDDALQSATTDKILAAIAKSGYPLQGQVIEGFQNVFAEWSHDDVIAEEWSFIDADTAKPRSLDVLVRRRLRGVNDEFDADPGIPADPRALVRHEIDFLVECKRSHLPHVFFTRKGIHAEDLPLILGMPHEWISLGFAGSESFFRMSLDDIAKYGTDVAECPIATVAARGNYKNGGDLELSGEDVFRGILFPLRKALQHYEDWCEPGERRIYFDARYVYPLVVLDAPMYSYDGSKLKAISHARLILNEPSVDDWVHSFNSQHSIDVVHFDALADYLGFAERKALQVASRVDRMALVAVTGLGVVPDSTGDDEQSNDDDPLSDLSPSMSGDEAIEWMRTRFIAAHQEED